MREYRDEAYIFTLAKYSPGRIIACRTPAGERHVGRSIFSCLKMDEGETDFFKEASASFGKTPIAALCRGDKRETVIFFRDLIFGASICLAIVTRIDAETVAAVLGSGTFGEMLISDGIKSARCEEFSYEKHKECYLYLLNVISCAEHIAALKLDYEPAGIDSIIRCAKGAAELAKVDVEVETSGCGENEILDLADEVFDGRICAAVLLTVAMAARYHSKDKKYRLEIASGVRSLSLSLSFRASDDGWRDAFDYLKHVSEDSYGIPFEYECHRGRVAVTLVPFYADVGFVGVKESDYFTSLVFLLGDN